MPIWHLRRVLNISLIFLEIRRILLQNPKQTKFGKSTGLFGSAAFKGQYSLITIVNLTIMYNKLYLLILFCLFSLFMITSCEKAEIHKSLVTINGEVQAREDDCVDDCEDCPINDCCCSVQLLSIGSTTLDFCGTSGPCVSTMACGFSGLPFCPDISGFLETITLTGQFSSALFCVPQNSQFGITSATGGTPQIRLTCQVGQPSPQFVTITLNSPPPKPYWSTGSDCSLTSCF